MVKNKIIFLKLFDIAMQSIQLNYQVQMFKNLERKRIWQFWASALIDLLQKIFFAILSRYQNKISRVPIESEDNQTNDTYSIQTNMSLIRTKIINSFV